MRLGYEDKSLALECASAIENGGACALTVHARTKVEGYEPPAHWEWVRKIRDAVSIPVTANGDVFSLQDYLDIKSVSGCDSVMLGARRRLSVPTWRGKSSNMKTAKQ